MIRHLSDRLGTLWTSISFRLTFNYGLLATLTTLGLVVLVYVQIMGAFHAQRHRLIERTTQRLMVVYEEGGRADLVKAIDLTLSDRIDSERELYLLQDENGKRLAGNLDTIPSPPFSYQTVFEANVHLHGIESTGYLKVVSLSDGSRLAVGQDTSEIDDITSLVARSVVAALFFSVLFIVAGTYVFRNELEYRVSTIRRTAEKIGAGQLSERIPVSGVEDEFTLLIRDTNTMLDRIQTLMQGVRYVSDTIAHNLRTPLMRVVGILRTAQQPGRSLDEVRQSTQSAIDEIDNLTVLFGKLLQIAEIEAGVRRQAFRACQLDAIVRDLVEMYDDYAQEKGLQLTADVPITATVLADPDLIASALANLMDNAMKYAVATVKINVFEEATGTVCIAVSDDGPGVPFHELTRLGTHFHRPDTSYPGHGLGLSSVLAIVRLHDGQLVFSLGEPGLTATVCIPVARPVAAA